MGKHSVDSPWLPPLGAVALGAISVGMVFALLSDNPNGSHSAESAPNTAALTSNDGEFTARLRSAHSGLCAGYDPLYHQTNGEAAYQTNCGTSSLSRFRFERQPDSDTYRITRSFDGKCLEAFAADGDANRVQFWNCHTGDAFRSHVATDAQLWQIENVGGNYYRIVSQSNGDALVIQGGSYTNLADLTLRGVTGSTDEQWYFDERVSELSDPVVLGEWGPLLSWPFVAVHAAVLPDNKVLSWSSHERESFTVLPYKNSTYTAVYDVANGDFTEPVSPSHDMFCSGTVQMADGRIMATGGNPQLQNASIFDPDSGTWSDSDQMAYPRWYGSSVALSDGDVFTTFAKGALEIPERYSEGAGWSELPGASMSTLLTDQNTTNQLAEAPITPMQWYAFMHAAPDGRVFHSGPTENLNWFDPNGVGSVQSAGIGLSRNRQFGSSVMYRPGELLVTGGVDTSRADIVSEFGHSLGGTNTAVTIDLNGSSAVLTPTESMDHARVNHNAVVMPNGEVMVIGGEARGRIFSDQHTAYESEIWNPDTGTWRAADRISSPRTYHSWAMLLQDATVIVGGGGLCGDCGVNHSSAQVYSPAYLYSADGSKALRPDVGSLASTLFAGEHAYVSVTGSQTDTVAFSLVRLSSATHSVNTDQRWIPVDATALEAGLFELSLPSNPNVLIPGNYWLFAYSANGAPSVGHPILIEAGSRGTDSAPIVPDHISIEFQPGSDVQAAVSAFEPDGQSVRFTAQSLPAGVTLNRATGALTGQVDSTTDFSTVVSVSDGSHTVDTVIHWTASSQQKQVFETGTLNAVFLLLLWVSGGVCAARRLCGHGAHNTRRSQLQRVRG